MSELKEKKFKMENSDYDDVEVKDESFDDFDEENCGDKDIGREKDNLKLMIYENTEVHNEYSYEDIDTKENINHKITDIKNVNNGLYIFIKEEENEEINRKGYNNKGNTTNEGLNENNSPSEDPIEHKYPESILSKNRKRKRKAFDRIEDSCPSTSRVKSRQINNIDDSYKCGSENLISNNQYKTDFAKHSVSDSSISIQDIITSLLEIPFSRRSDSERNEILKRGRPTPKFSLLKKYKDRIRTFQSSWYDQHKWLCGSETKSKLFCWPCVLLCTNKTVWSDEGFDDLKNVSRALVRHASTKDHLNAHLLLKNLSKQIFTASELLNEHSRLLKIKYNDEVKKNREIFKILLNVTSLLCKQKLAFRGHDEVEEPINRGNFKAIFQLVLSKNAELKQHWENKDFFRGLYKTIQNDLIECIQDEIKNFIESNINQAPFFACMVNENTDISEKTQYSIIIRLVDCNGEIREHFLGFYDVDENRTADGLCSVLYKALEKFNIQHKLIAQTYDGASVMAEELNCLQAKVRELAPHALFTHCFAHRLNLILQHSCSKIKSVKIFFSTLQGIPAFFHRSSKRTAVIDRVLGKCIPINSEVRWNSNSKIISAVYTNRLKLIEVFKELMDSSLDTVTVREAQGYLNNLKDFTFVFLLSIFQDIFQKTDLLFNIILQKHSNDIDFCNSSVFECISYIRNMRDNNIYDEFIQSAESTTGCSSPILKRQEVRNNEVVSSNYYKQIYFEILDNIITQLEVRFSSCEKLTFLKLGDTNNFSQYDRKFHNDAMRSLIEIYGAHFNKEKLRTELETIFSPLHKDTFHNLKLNILIKKMNDDRTNEILPEAYKLFSLIVTIPTSTFPVKGFSCLKRIKTYLRNCMTQDHTLALVSIEKEIVSTLERRPSWDDDVIDRFAKKRDRQVNLLYK